jgi:hypothetical protein
MWKLLYNVHNIHGSYKILRDRSSAHKIMIDVQGNTILEEHEHLQLIILTVPDFSET